MIVGHLLLELAKRRLEAKQMVETAEHVLTQGLVRSGRRALVVECDGNTLAARELTAIERELTRQNAEQRGLASPVGPREGYPVAWLERERDTIEEAEFRRARAAGWLPRAVTRSDG